MKFQVMLRILFKLLRARKTSAAQLAAEEGVSERSVYRYVDELTVSGVPIDIIRGRNGGICLPDTYRLPQNFFTQEEHAAAINALSALGEQLGDRAIASALEKLRSQQKSDSKNLTLSGNILVDSGSWGDAYDFSEKLKVLEEAVEKCDCLDMTYIARSGEESRRTIEPHLLIYKQNIWYVYAWCRKRSAFRLFKIGRIRSARATGEKFEKRPFDRENLPLKFEFSDTELVRVSLEVKKKALADAEEWLGIANISPRGDGFLAEATLPLGEALYAKILGFGDGVRVLSPDPVAQEVKARAQALLQAYKE